MRIFFKAAHYVVRTYYSRELIRKTLVKYLYEVKPAVSIGALEELAKRPDTDKADRCIFDFLGPQCNTKERKILQACINDGYCKRTYRASLALMVDPRQTIGTLKSDLKGFSWVPKENLVLVQHKERPIEDDSSTVAECGIREDDSLLAVMGRSFPLTVKHVSSGEELVIPMRSCFETVADLKEKIHQKAGHLSENMSLKYQKKVLSRKDGDRLVAVGIVSDMPERSIELH